MNIMVNRAGSGLKLHLSGCLDISCVLEAKEKFGPILEMGLDQIVDLSALEQIDTAGTQLLMLVHRQAAASGTDCRFVGAVQEVARILEFYRLPGLEASPATES